MGKGLEGPNSHDTRATLWMPQPVRVLRGRHAVGVTDTPWSFPTLRFESPTVLSPPPSTHSVPTGWWMDGWVGGWVGGWDWQLGGQ